MLIVLVGVFFVFLNKKEDKWIIIYLCVEFGGI